MGAVSLSRVRRIDCAAAIRDVTRMPTSSQPRPSLDPQPSRSMFSRHLPCARAVVCSTTRGALPLLCTARTSSTAVAAMSEKAVAKRVVWPCLTLDPAANAWHGTISLGRCDRRVDMRYKPTSALKLPMPCCGEYHDGRH
ncbi:hypothetical protein CC86DRAFT_174765 [Ophiobolus disseminans]|uniref:Uncharacterized protein n=1 Tax=Ophiobolus disseminans TaxID=1469910 RepID=A0A6A7A9D3_9PLEO|nr:hypothetical protein CC86DRAFT_174765 [Ophiobolus disseminans]